MARKKATTKKSKVSKATRVTKASAVKKQNSAMTSFMEFIRLGESYTSLVLGALVVIIVTILLLSVVHNRQEGQNTPDATPTIASSNSFAISTTAAIKQAKDKMTPAPSTMPTPVALTHKAKQGNAKTYTVMANDNLWMIAQKVYNSGYNWVDIAKANNLAQPGDIHIGDKLVLPQVAPKMLATVHTTDDNMSSTMAEGAGSSRIIGNTYVVMHGDDLWDIAVRSYGDGYQWVQIAKANNLSNPGLIHAGNKLLIPRG